MKKMVVWLGVLCLAIGLSGCVTKNPSKDESAAKSETVFTFNKGVAKKVIQANQVGQIDIKGSINKSYNNIAVIVNHKVQAILPVSASGRFIYQAQGYNQNTTMYLVAKQNAELSDVINPSNEKCKVSLYYVPIQGAAKIALNQVGKPLNVGLKKTVQGKQVASLGNAINYSNGLSFAVNSVDNADGTSNALIKVNFSVSNTSAKSVDLPDSIVKVTDSKSQAATFVKDQSQFQTIDSNQTINQIAAFKVKGNKPYLISIGAGNWSDQ